VTLPPEYSSRPLDERLRDDDALTEIELVSRLIIAASESERPLSVDRIDALLGVRESNDG